MIRQIRRAPGFYTIAISLIAFGIAATTLNFTLVDTVLLRPLPVKNPENLVQPFEIRGTYTPSPYFDTALYRQIATESKTLFDMIAKLGGPALLDPGGGPQRVQREYVTDNFFSVLGVRPILGRTLDPGEHRVFTVSS